MLFGASTGNDLWFTSLQGRLYGSDDDYIGYIDVTSQATTLYQVAQTPTTAPIIGSDGNIWVGFGNYIGKITQSSSQPVIYYPAGTTSANQILAGPDGKIWYASSSGYVSRMSTSGKVLTTKQVAFSNYFGQWTVGPDDNVWIATGKAIVEMPNGRTVVELKVPKDRRCWPASITVGPSNDLWFSQIPTEGAYGACTKGLGTVIP